MKRQRPPRRIILVVLLCLLAGAIVNIAVAWAIAVWGPPVGTVIQSESGWRSDIVEWWKRVALPAYGTSPLRTQWTNSMGYDAISAIGKRSRFEHHSVEIERRRYGWPARGLECTCWTEAPASSSAHSKVEGIQFQMKDKSARVLPTVILPKFFAINTVFYAAVLWLILAFPFALRRRRRIKRGLCPKCAYPVGSSDVCTECGTAVK